MYKHSKMFISAAVVAAAMAPLGAQAPQTVPLQSVRDSGYLMFRSPDGAFAYWLDGRVQIDAAVYKGGNTHLASGTDVRRARMGWKATMFKNWHGEMDVDFAENGVDMKDMWIGYEGFKNQLLKVGNFREPFSLETMTSSKYITFLERSYIDNFSPDRRMGMSYTRWGNWYQTSVGLFGQEIGTVDATAASEGWAMTGRFVASPIHQDGKVVHLGLALSRRTPDAAAGVDTHTVRFRARPETDLSKVRFLTTGKVRGVDHTSYYNFEFSSVYGPFTLQSEYTRVALRKLVDTLDSPTFDGFYVTGSWFLTGETRPYLMEEGEYGRIFPKHES
ncbi:MAG TPA: porin, partial [Gemmatimonadaceae bacterium]